MNIIVISECEKAAWKKTRRVVSKYLFQAGRRTWMGSITEEGLKDLHNELKVIASKNMSVICHKVVARNWTKVAFIVGTKKHFDDSGNFCFSNSSIPLPKENRPPPGIIKVLVLANVFAGLMHDFAKQIYSFQNKIRLSSPKNVNGKKIIIDPIRHDRLSAECLCTLYTYIRSKKTVRNERDLFSFFSKIDKNNLDCLFGQNLSAKNIRFKDDKGEPSQINNLLKELLTTANGKYRIFSLILHLVLSHHFLSYSKKESRNEIIILEKRYVHASKGDDIEKLLNRFGKPVWENDKWLKNFRNAAKRIMKSLKDVKEFNYDQLLAYANLIARPALVAADQFVSAKGNQKEYSGGNKEEICFANTVDMRRDKLAQPLDEHLIEVAKYAGRKTYILGRLWQGELLDYIEKTPQILKQNKDFAPSFAWQAQARNLAAKIKIKSSICEGFFGIVMAETGSGKTRANAGIMCALQGNKNIRFTLALGLRTLTEQSGYAYIREMEFKENEEVSVLIGGAFRSYQENPGEPSDEPDKDDIATTLNDEGLPADLILGSEYIEPDSPFPKNLVEPRSNENLKFKILSKMIQVPVLICTIDHIMAALTSQKSTDAKRMIRVLTSDLIIDEIDSFSVEDIEALARLIYYTGLAGRRVLLSSATISSVMAKHLFAAYIHGYKGFIQTQGCKPVIRAAWFSNIEDVIGEKKIDVNNRTTFEFVKLHKNYADQMVEQLKLRLVRRRMEFLDIGDCKELGSPQIVFDKVYEKISKSIDQLHNSHHVKYNGKRVSVGLIRISNTKNALEIFKRLFKTPESDGSRRLLVFYHAKLLDSTLSKVEAALNRLLVRKHTRKETDPIFDQPEIVSVIKEYPDCKDFQIIIVATTIEEVGRDHDFDWGIFEPTSNSSAIQASGRIWRHREWKILGDKKVANVIMFSHNFRAILTKRCHIFYRWPGPENDKHRLDSNDARYLLDRRMLETIDARYALIQDETPGKTNEREETIYSNMSQIEHGRIKSGLEKVTGSHGDLIKTITKVSNAYEELHPFRDSTGAIDIEIIRKDCCFSLKYFTHEISELDNSLIETFDTLIPSNSEKLLLNHGNEKTYDDVSGKTVLHKYHGIPKFLLGAPKSDKIWFSPVIGVLLD